MAQPQQNVGIAAPGFMGLNTQDSPLQLGPEWASVADNCIIDQYGRIASRRGFQQITNNPDLLNGQRVQVLKEFIDVLGVKYMFACGNLGIFIQELEPPFDLIPLMVPVGYNSNLGITADNWQIVPFNDLCYFVQAGHPPLVFDPAFPTALRLWAENPDPDAPGAIGVGFPNCATATFGRLWCGDFDNDKSIVTWSNLLDGEAYTVDAGSLELEKYWPSGYDEVVSIVGHNDFLIIFGKRSIVVYQTTADVGSTITLVDTVEGIGCIARDSVVPTGKDMLFCDATGIRSFGRTIQEKSMPVGDLSLNVRSDFKKALVLEPEDDIKAVFHTEDAFYAIFLPSNPKTYVFDQRVTLENGSSRATQWINVVPVCGVRTQDRQTYFGGLYGVYQYRESDDAAKTTDAGDYDLQSINLQYVTHPQDWGAPSNVKFPKQCDVTVIGGRAVQLCLKWAFDYSNTFEGLCLNLSGGETSEWNISEFNEPSSEFTDGILNVTPKFNMWGSGRNIKIGFDADVSGAPFAFQEINIQALQGRIL